MKNIITLLAISFFSIQLVSLTLEFEDTWKQHTIYKNGITTFENKLYVNAYTVLEIYTILDNGELEIYQTVDQQSLIRGLAIDESDSMLYIQSVGYISGSVEKMKAYRIVENELIFRFSVDLENAYFDLYQNIFIVSDFVLLGQGNNIPYYNKSTNTIGSTSFPYGYILGSFDNKLITYNHYANEIKFYQVDDINNPTLLYQYSYDLPRYYFCSTKKFDASHLIITNIDEMLFFSVANPENIHLVNTYYINLELATSENFEALYPPIMLESGEVYAGTFYGENFIWNMSDFLSPTVIHNWIEDGSDVNTYTLNINTLYKSKNRLGIWSYNLDQPDTGTNSVFGKFVPNRSNCFIEGIVYKNENSYLYKVDPEIGDWEEICEVPISVGWEYYKEGNKLIIHGGGNFISYCNIVDLETNQLLNQIQLSGPILRTHNGKVFVANGYDIDIFEITESNQLNLLNTITSGGNQKVHIFDEELVWISHTGGEFLFNTNTCVIEIDYGDFFSPTSYRFSRPVKYNNRLIVADNHFECASEVKLYDISDMENPILLDSKTESVNPAYFLVEDLIIETQSSNPIRVYNRFENNFTEPIQEIDLDSVVMNLTFDEEHHRMANSTFYYLKTYTYEVTENGIDIVPELTNSLSNYPNPFNPTTEIIFQIADHNNQESVQGSVTIEIYNTKGQRIRKYKIDNVKCNINKITWDGRNSSGKPVASGVYLYTLKIENRIIGAKKMLLLK